MNNKAKENVKEITFEDAMVLKEAVDTLLLTSPTMKGKLVFTLNRAQGKLKSVANKIKRQEKEILSKYIETDKDKNLVLVPLTKKDKDSGQFPPHVTEKYKYKDPKKGQEKAHKEMADFLAGTVEVELRPIMQADFENLDINTVRNPNIGLVIEHLVKESEMSIA